MAQYSKEAYEKIQLLCEENRIFSGARIHVEVVQKKVAKLLWIPYVLPSEIVHDLILEHRRKRWTKAFSRYPADEFRQWIAWAILKTYNKQGNLWQNIRWVIEAHNTKFPEELLPVDKHNIGLSLLGKREMKLEEFMEALSIQLPIEMNSGAEQAYSLRSIWREHLDGKFIQNHTEIPLRKALLKIKISLRIATWQKRVLGTVQAYEQQHQIYLWSTSWVTLSRSIIGKEHDYVSQIDFLNFIKKAGVNTNSAL